MMPVGIAFTALITFTQMGEGRVIASLIAELVLKEEHSQTKE